MFEMIANARQEIVSGRSSRVSRSIAGEEQVEQLTARLAAMPPAGFHIGH